MITKDVLQLIDDVYKNKTSSLNLNGFRRSHLLEIPNQIQYLTHLTSLDLGNNRLTIIPSWIDKLENLEELNLYNNNISVIPSEIGSLQKLRYLDLRSNTLTYVPSTIGMLAKLETLLLGSGHDQEHHIIYAGSNQLTSLPREIGKLSALKCLTLGDNQLAELPLEIFYLKNLVSLSIADNRLVKLPRTISKLKRLRYLFLEGNPLPIPKKIIKTNKPRIIINYYLLSSIFSKVVPLPPLLTSTTPSLLGSWILYAMILLAILGVISLLQSIVFNNHQLLFPGQMTLLTACVSLIPTIANRLTQQRGRTARIVLETGMFTLTFILFALGVFGVSGLGIWITYAIGLILLLETGSHLIERYLINTLRRIFKTTSLSSLQDEAEYLQRMYKNELITYIPIPIGLLIGTAIGSVKNWSPYNTIIFCVQIVLALTSMVLFVFIISAFTRMVDSLFRESTVSSTKIVQENKTGISGIFGKVLRFLTPSPQNKVNQEEQDVSLAYMVTDLRKIYLYDSLHNITLLVSFVAISFILWNFSIDGKLVLAALLVSSLILGQLPFVIGQSLLHEKVLERYEGIERAEMAEKLKKHAPLFPTLEFLTALSATGTAGGILYFILDRFVKDLLK